MNQLAYHFNSAELRGGKVYVDDQDFDEYSTLTLTELKNAVTELKAIRKELRKIGVY